MAINLYSKASVDSLLSAKLSISSLTNAAATTLNATAPTTDQVLSFDGTELKWATVSGGGGAAWGGITGTLSNQTDLQNALDAKYDASNPSGFITSAALSGYLLASTAASTYQTLAGMSAYLTTASASSTYQTQAAMSAYLTSATAASTYQPIGSYLTDAPSDGSTYGRNNGAWVVAGGGGVAWGGITGTLSDQTDLQSALDLKAPLSSPAFDGTATFTGSGGTVSLNDQGLDLSASTAGGLITAGTSGITFSDSTTQQTAYNPDRAQADAIANIIYTQSSGSTGDICFSNVPQFLSNLTTNWGIVDNSAVYEYCTGFSGATYTLSGSVGSGPYKVRVNGIDSSFTI